MGGAVTVSLRVKLALVTLASLAAAAVAAGNTWSVKGRADGAGTAQRFAPAAARDDRRGRD
jgi:hypothetical protein